MSSIYTYINSFKDIEIKDNKIEIIDGELVIFIVCERKIENDFLLKNDFKIKSVTIRKYKNYNKEIVNELYFFLSISYQKINIIPKYSLNRDTNNKDKIFFEIVFIVDEELNLDNITSLLTYKNEKIQQMLSPFKLEGSLLTEVNNIGIVQSNTKTRRLGYLKLIVEQFENSNYFPVTYLNKRIEADSALYTDELYKYGNIVGDDKGLIKKTSTGSSAKPYIELLEELNLLTHISSSYILTKQSKIYFHLNKYLKEKNFKDDHNLFQLNLLDKLFFLRQILLADPLYIWVVLDIIFIAQKPIGTMSIKKLFVDYVKNELTLNEQYSNKTSTKRRIKELHARISSWKKPITYLEHLVEPRINWLLDLGVLEINSESKEKQYCLSKFGMKLANVLCKIFENYLNKQLILQSIINNHYFYTFNYIFDLNKSCTSWDVEKVESYLLEAFQIFKTDAPNRIAASQAIDYVCFKSFFEDNLIIEFEDVKKHLLSNNNKFSMDWFKTENDGALYLKK